MMKNTLQSGKSRVYFQWRCGHNRACLACRGAFSAWGGASPAARAPRAPVSTSHDFAPEGAQPRLGPRPWSRCAHGAAGHEQLTQQRCLEAALLNDPPLPLPHRGLAGEGVVARFGIPDRGDGAVRSAGVQSARVPRAQIRLQSRSAVVGLLRRAMMAPIGGGSNLQSRL
jgi:hypothetical protein